MKKMDEVLGCNQPVKKMKSCKQLWSSTPNDYRTTVTTNCILSTFPDKPCTTAVS